MTLGWLNAFQFCKCLKALGHIMVLIVVALVGLSFYAVVIKTLGPAIASSDVALQIVNLALAGIFTFVVVMILWSYFAAVVTDPGSVPDGWNPYEDEETAQRALRRLTTYGDAGQNRADPRRPRYCRKCQQWKPERTHHCSVSGRCILKMDHYCIWVVNCVGLLNYKFFLLFLVYTWLGSLMALFILVPSLVEKMSTTEVEGGTVVFLAVVIDAAFVLSLLGFLAMHLRLLTINCTSIEMYEKQRINPWPFDRGSKWRNVEEVLGTNRWMWCIPIITRNEKQRLTDLILSQKLMDRMPPSPHEEV